MRRTILGALLLLGCSPGEGADGLGGQGPTDGAGGSAGSGGAPICVTPEEMIPNGCAEPRPDLGECVYVAKDEDGDGFPGECEVPQAVGVTFLRDVKEPAKKWDCDDDNKLINPDGWDGPPIPGRPNGCYDEQDNDCSLKTDDGRGTYGGTEVSCKCRDNVDHLPCSETPQGEPIEFPDGEPVGECKEGSRLCDDSRWEECNGAVGPRPETCAQYLAAAEKDYDCDGKPAEEELNDPENGVVDTRRFYCDADGDGRLATDRESVLSVRACAPPETGCGPDDDGSWIEKPQSSAFSDCDDEDPDVGGKNRDEVCDDKDNDCDGDIDENITFDGQLASFACQGGQPMILSCPAGKLSCDEDILGNGCETPIDIDHCYGCSAACDLMCSQVTQGCATIESLALGELFSCGLLSDGRIACWGEGSSGQLGDGQALDSQVPVLALGINDAQAIAAGSAHVCFIRQNGDVHCFGEGQSGRLGRSDEADLTSPDLTRTVHIEEPAASLALGLGHSCAVTTSQHLKCWGDGSSGQLGNSGTESQPIPADAYRLDEYGYEWLLVDVEQASTGHRHTCIRTSDGLVSCTGDSTYGQIGTPAFGEPGYFELVPGLDDVSSICSGADHNCAVSDGKVYCWGRNNLGQVGQATGLTHAAPQEIAGLTDAISVACGGANSCVLRVDGTVQCWGSNSNGQLGAQGPSGLSAAPIVIDGISGAVQLVMGDAHACVQQADGSLLCWGFNQSGQLGRQGGPSFDPVPAPIAPFASLPL